MIVSLIAMSLAIMVLVKKAPTGGLVTFIEHIELSDEQIQSNRDFFDFADISLTLAPVFLVFYVSVLVLLASFVKKASYPLQAFGRMAFTNYIGQTLILVSITLFIPKGTTMMICLVVVGIQMTLSVYWFNYFKYGPLEWLWRCGTYQKWLSIRKS